MKKLFVMALAVGLVIAFTAPAMATDWTFDGQYRIRQITNSRPDLLETSASDSWQEMRFRMRSDFVVNDNLKLITRFDALDGKKYGEGDKNTGNDGDNIDFDRAYMVITTDFGQFLLGRMQAGTWGGDFLNTEKEADRLRYQVPIGDLTLLTIFEKGAAEQDAGSAFTDSDYDKYYLAGIYKMEDMTFGLLSGYFFNKTASDRTTPLNPLAGETFADLAYDRDVYLIDTYLDAKFGAIGVYAELGYQFGTLMEFDRDVYASDVATWEAAYGAAIGDPTYKLEDVDVDTFAWNLEVTYDMAPFGFEIGYAWAKGDDNPLDSTYETFALGEDWTKLFILTGNDVGQETSMGPHAGAVGSGNLNAGDAVSYGAKIFYLGATFSPMEDLTLGLLFGNSKAEAPPSGVSQDHGSEYDLSVNWKVYDNLSYKFVFAYLDAGDFWQGGDTTIDLENTYTLFQEFSLSF